MSIFTDIAGAINNNSVAGGRIYYQILPKTPKYPCGVFSRAGGGPIHDFEGDIDLDYVIVQFDIFGLSMAEAQGVLRDLRAAFRATPALQYFKTQSIRDGGFEEETEPDTFHVSADMQFWQRTA